MTAYDVAAWTDFAITVPGRAAATLAVTVAILLTAVFVATPGQDHRALAVEIGMVGVVTAVLTAVFGTKQRSSPHPARALTSMVLLCVLRCC